MVNVYDRGDLPELLRWREVFKSPYGEAKGRYGKNPEDYDAKVDVCFYRLLFKKLNQIIFVVKRKGVYYDKPYETVTNDVLEAEIDEQELKRNN